ncbi:MAG: flavodoxin [Clostridiales bacterium]|nr:flavodoxin [Clostridiales bacterium]
MRMFKKVMTLAVSAAFMCGLASCSKNPVADPSASSASAQTEKSLVVTEKETTETSETEKDSKFGKALVVYFSCTGNTKDVALKIANEVGCGTYEIVPSKAYTTDDLNYNNKKSRATREQNDKNARPEIEGTVDLSSYDTIFLGYPIWFAKAPRILCTFVEGQNFEGKKIIPFCTSGSSIIGSSATELAELAQNKGRWISGTRFGANVKSTDVAQWIAVVEGEI